MLAILLGVGTYSCLSAYAVYRSADRRLEADQAYLRSLNLRKQELLRKQKVLRQARQFSLKAADLGLREAEWTFYDVNVQDTFSFETARQIIEQCSNSDLAYYWPISLEVKTAARSEKKAGARDETKAPGEVQLTVKGRFLTRQQ